MSKPKSSYDLEWRKKKWAEIPSDKKMEWSLKLRELFRAHDGSLTVKELVTIMGVPKWQVYFILTPLIDSATVYVLEEDERGLSVELVHWEKHVILEHG